MPMLSLQLSRRELVNAEDGVLSSDFHYQTPSVQSSCRTPTMRTPLITAALHRRWCLTLSNPVPWHNWEVHHMNMWQELNCRKWIMRQLCTQYVKGINSNPVTLKSRLRVTQGYWKWYHWIDHTRLTIWRRIWPWNVGVRGHSRSFKLVPFKSFGTVSCS